MISASSRGRHFATLKFGTSKICNLRSEAKVIVGMYPSTYLKHITRVNKNCDEQFFRATVHTCTLHTIWGLQISMYYSFRCLFMKVFHTCKKGILTFHQVVNIPSAICIDQFKLVSGLGVHSFRRLSKDVSASSEYIVACQGNFYSAIVYPPNTKQSLLSLFSYTPHNFAMLVCFTALCVSI